MSRTRYAGYTLIELSITMTVGSTLMILSVGLIHQAMRYHSVTRDRSLEHRLMDRFSGDFRPDIHRAKSAEVKSDGELELTYHDQTIIRFAAEEDFIERTLFLDGKVIRKETYQFRRAITCKFVIQSDLNQVGLTIQSGSTGQIMSSAPKREFKAVLGRLLQHQTARVNNDV
ncbi:MAG: hypothetical protein VXZ38_07550 [Planctomycetota bacterium]|nr:hypothetical protein [Planctomycetota bacterium]